MRARIQKISKYAPSVFQGKIEFAARTGISLTIEHPAERAVFRMLAGTFAILVCAYVYFVGMSILNVIGRKEALTQISHLSSAVAALERDYLAASQGVGPEDGARLGLSPVTNTVYVRRPGNAALAGQGPSGQAAATLESNEI